MRYAAAAIVWILFATDAMAAETLTSNDLAKLLKGEPVVRVTRDAASKSFASGSAFAVIDVPTPPEAVFVAMTDCARLKVILKNLVSCRSLKRDPAGAWEIRETIMRVSVALPDFRAVARLDYTPPRQVRFKQTEGNFDYAEGQWDLVPFREGRTTRLFYRVRAGTSMPVPEFVIQNAIETELPATLKGIRAEAIKVHAARTPVPK
jgi:hypothetical protein